MTSTTQTWAWQWTLHAETLAHHLVEALDDWRALLPDLAKGTINVQVGFRG